MSVAMGMMPSIAGGAVGVLSGAGQSAQSGVVTPQSPLSDAGTSLAGAGSSLGAAVGSLFGMSGMLNVSVANTRTDSIGIAHAMQVGMTQAVNIGQTKMETIGQAHTHTVGQQMIVNVGQEMQINVGNTFHIIVGGGAATLTMDSDRMLIRNETPFAAQGFGDLQRDGVRMAVVCVRGSYQIAADGALQLVNQQKIALADVYEGDPDRTPSCASATSSPTSRQRT